MRTIFKYELEITDYQEIEMPSAAKILSVQDQAGKLMLWARVFKQAEPETRRIWIFGTGNPMPEMVKLIYIGTVQMEQLVWHVFEEPTLED